VTAIVFTSAVAVTLALSVSFVGIAVISALSRLLTYGSTAAATLRLRSHPGGADVKPATFVAPLGSTAPILAICVCVALTAGATRQQLLGGAAALAAGAVLHAVNGLFARRQQTVPTA
jgi:amino acid permease